MPLVALGTIVVRKAPQNKTPSPAGESDTLGSTNAAFVAIEIVATNQHFAVYAPPNTIKNTALLPNLVTVYRGLYRQIVQTQVLTNLQSIWLLIKRAKTLLITPPSISAVILRYD